MKCRSILSLTAAGLGCGALGWILSRDRDDPRLVALAARARADATAAGFKLTHQFASPAEAQARRQRVAPIVKAVTLALRPDWTRERKPMDPGGLPGQAMSEWRRGGPSDPAQDILAEDAVELSAARAALLDKTSFQFPATNEDQLGQAPFMPGLVSLAEVLTAQMIVELGAGRMESAWTSLWVINGLAVRFEPEPFEAQYDLRGDLYDRAMAANWEALRTNAWSEANLAALAALWTAADPLKNAGDAESGRANELLAIIRKIRTANPGNATPALTPKSLFSDPVRSIPLAIAQFKENRQRKVWIHGDSYREEARIIHLFQSRKIEIDQALEQKNWLAMRSLPGAKDAPPFKFPVDSPVELRWAEDLLALRSLRARFGASSTFLERLARQECVRRVLLAAIAVERIRLKTGQLPDSLSLVPGVPDDFATGRPLLYRPSSDGDFFLFSVGTDGQDDGGDLGGVDATGVRHEARDVVWPRGGRIEKIVW